MYAGVPWQIRRVGYSHHIYPFLGRPTAPPQTYLHLWTLLRVRRAAFRRIAFDNYLTGATKCFLSSPLHPPDFNPTRYDYVLAFFTIYRATAFVAPSQRRNTVAIPSPYRRHDRLK